MSTSVLYHGFGVRDYKYLKTEYCQGEVIFHVEKDPPKIRCAECKSNNVIKFGRVERRVRTVPIGQRRVWLVLHLHRLQCRDCSGIALEPVLLAFARKHWTKHLGRYILELLKHATVQDVAEHLDMSWDTVKEIHAWALTQQFRRRRIQHLEYLGVDEIAVKKGHKYLTLVVDLQSGEVVWVAEAREMASLEPFLRRLKQAKAPIKAIAMDMWPAYIGAVLRYYPSEVIVFDRYHVISDYNKVLDELRRQEAAAAPEVYQGAYVGVRYLLLKGQERIQDRPEAKAKLDRLLALNQTLNTAYILKEELRDLWNCPTRQDATDYLCDWLKKAEASGIHLLQKFAKTLAAHRSGILNYFDHPITTAKVEGINNKIKVLKRQAYGFRDMAYFKLRIYFLHQSTYALVG
jgi:transposase